MRTQDALRQRLDPLRARRRCGMTKPLPVWWRLTRAAEVPQSRPRPAGGWAIVRRRLSRRNRRELGGREGARRGADTRPPAPSSFNSVRFPAFAPAALLTSSSHLVVCGHGIAVHNLVRGFERMRSLSPRWRRGWRTPWWNSAYSPRRACCVRRPCGRHRRRRGCHQVPVINSTSRPGVCARAASSSRTTSVPGRTAPATVAPGMVA